MKKIILIHLFLFIYVFNTKNAEAQHCDTYANYFCLTSHLSGGLSSCGTTVITIVEGDIVRVAYGLIYNFSTCPYQMHDTMYYSSAGVYSFYFDNHEYRFEIIVDSATSVNENEANVGVNIFPNPVASELTVDSQKLREIGTIEIYNAFGEKVFSQQTINTQQTSIDVSSLRSGIYFITLTNEAGNKAVRKFVKM